MIEKNPTKSRILIRRVNTYFKYMAPPMSITFLQVTNLKLLKVLNSEEIVDVENILSKGKRDRT